MNVGREEEEEEEAAVEGEMNVADTHPRHVFIALARALALLSLSLGGGLLQFLLLREHMTCVNHESKPLGWDNTRVQRNSKY